MYEGYARNEFGDRPPEYFGDAFDKQYCEMIFADMEEAETAGRNAADLNTQKGSFFKKAGNLLMKSWRSLRPNSVTSSPRRNKPTP